MVKAHAPAALHGLGVEEMEQDGKNLQYYRDVQHDEERFSYGVEVLITNSEQSLDARTRGVYRRVKSLMTESFDFGHDLKALQALITESAEEGVETRKRLTKTRAEVKEGKGPEGGAPPHAAGRAHPGWDGHWRFGQAASVGSGPSALTSQDPTTQEVLTSWASPLPVDPDMGQRRGQA